MSHLEPDRIGEDYAAAIRGCGTQRDAARHYADALRTYGPDAVNWKTVNDAILARWSISGLKKIKRDAWKIAHHPTPR